MEEGIINQQLLSFATDYAKTLFAIERALSQVEADFCCQAHDARQNLEKEKKILINQAADQSLRHRIALRETSGRLMTKKGDITDAAEYLVLGELDFPELNHLYAEQGNLVPYILPFLGKSNLFVRAQGDTLLKAMRCIVWNALAQTAPGQLEVIVYNPNLCNALSPLSALYEAGLLRFITQEDEWEAYLKDISEEIIRIDNILGGKHASLLDLRKECEQAVGQLRVVVCTEIASQLREESHTRLMNVMNTAAHTGTSFVLFHEEQISLPKWINLARLKDICCCLQRKKNGWQDGNDLVFTFQSLSDVALQEQGKLLAEAAGKSKAINLPFEQIERIAEKWVDSSARGICFALGKEGMETISITMGDNISQMHNALISGAAGQGKSNLLEVMIHSLCNRYSPDELALYLLDFKDGMTFSPYAENGQREFLPHARVLGLESERDFGLAVLRHIEQIREDRARQMSRSNVSSLEQFRERFPEVIMPRILVIIDEFHRLFEQNDDTGLQAADCLENLARQGRACGIHLILASQTITGADALLNREDRIYGQFPIRIALKNNTIQSFATFMQGNDGAAKLKARGEAVLNLNYGMVEDNRFFTVACADTEQMADFRREWWERTNGIVYPPVVFRKEEKCRLWRMLADLAYWRQKILKEGASPVIPLGMTLSVDKSLVSVSMEDSTGRNLAVLGAGDSHSNSEGESVGTNNAIGVLQAAALALALQHPLGNARFVLLDGLDANTARFNQQGSWMLLMQRFGFVVEVIPKEEAGTFLITLAEQMKEKQPKKNERIYLLGFAIDRCTSIMERNDLSGDCGADSFRELLKYGASQGIHILSWWINMSMFKEHLGYGNEGYMETKLLLRMDEGAAQSVLGPFIHWSVKENRGLLHDQTQLENTLTIIPFVPMTLEDRRQFESMEWEVAHEQRK